ncbi:MAG: guanylyltransferase, partial [Bacteroidota bacterium]
HCYWNQRKSGLSSTKATDLIKGMSIAAKNELLFQAGINFNDLPNWQKRGIGLYWEEYEKIGKNLKTGEEVKIKRRQIKVDYDLPMKEAYSIFIEEMLKEK